MTRRLAPTHGDDAREAAGPGAPRDFTKSRNVVVRGTPVEVRNYVTSFKGLSGELDSRRARNDLSISSGMTVRF
jgi:hypothetical protein